MAAQGQGIEVGGNVEWLLNDMGFFWHDKNVQKLGGGDGYKTVKISKSLWIVYFKRMIILVYELYINKTTF